MNPMRILGDLIAQSGVPLEEGFERNIERLAAYCEATVVEGDLAECDTVWEAVVELCRESGMGLQVVVARGAVRVLPADPLQSLVTPGQEWELRRLL